MGIEDRENELGIEKSIIAKKKLIDGLSSELGINSLVIEKYIFQESKDKQLFQKCRDIPNSWMIANALYNAAISVGEHHQVLNDEQLATVASCHGLSSEYENDIFGEYYSMQSGKLHDFEMASQRLRAAAITLKATKIDGLMSSLESLFLIDLAENFSVYYDQLPSEIKILLTKKEKEEFLDPDIDTSELDEFSETFLKKIVDRDQEKKDRLMSRGVHPKIARRIVQQETERSTRALNEVADKLKKEKFEPGDFLKIFLAKYPNPRALVRKIIGDEANIPEAKIKENSK